MQEPIHAFTLGILAGAVAGAMLTLLIVFFPNAAQAEIDESVVTQFHYQDLRSEISFVTR